MHIVIESGLMYTVSVVIVFVVFLTSNNAQYAVSDCVSSPLHLREVLKLLLTRYTIFQVVQIIVSRLLLCLESEVRYV